MDGKPEWQVDPSEFLTPGGKLRRKRIDHHAQSLRFWNLQQNAANQVISAVAAPENKLAIAGIKNLPLDFADRSDENRKG